MKTLNLKSIKKSGLGIIIALFIGSSVFANDNTAFDNIITEETEVLDSWMTDLSSWKSLKESTFNVDMEEDLELEAWMTNPNSEIWSSDQEEEIVIEDWMIEAADLYQDSIESEEELSMETWMVSPTEWMK